MEAASTDAEVERLVQSIMFMCEEYSFDGVDMDWEHPGWMVPAPASMRG